MSLPPRRPLIFSAALSVRPRGGSLTNATSAPFTPPSVRFLPLSEFWRVLDFPYYSSWLSKLLANSARSTTIRTGVILLLLKCSCPAGQTTPWDDEPQTRRESTRSQRGCGPHSVQLRRTRSKAATRSRTGLRTDRRRVTALWTEELRASRRSHARESIISRRLKTGRLCTRLQRKCRRRHWYHNDRGSASLFLTHYTHVPRRKLSIGVFRLQHRLVECPGPRRWCGIHRQRLLLRVRMRLRRAQQQPVVGTKLLSGLALGWSRMRCSSPRKKGGLWWQRTRLRRRGGRPDTRDASMGGKSGIAESVQTAAKACASTNVKRTSVRNVAARVSATTIGIGASARIAEVERYANMAGAGASAENVGALRSARTTVRGASVKTVGGQLSASTTAARPCAKIANVPRRQARLEHKHCAARCCTRAMPPERKDVTPSVSLCAEARVSCHTRKELH